MRYKASLQRADRNSCDSGNPSFVHLAADIGGTKTNLALFVEEDERFELIAEERLATRAVAGPEQLLADFLRRHGRQPVSAGIGVAGTVAAGEAHAVNLPWTIRQTELRRQLGIPHLHLLNDLAAMAYSVPFLREDQKARLLPGEEDAQAPIGLIAAGTGLGQALLVREDGHLRVLASEGGHRDFAPTTPQQWRLAEHLRHRYGHVSTERVLSGQGLLDLHHFLLAEEGIVPPDWLVQAAAAGNAAPVTDHALAGTDAACLRSALLFTAVYGAEAGNLALQYLAAGGIYLGGGIAPKLLPLLRQSAFAAAFRDKGRLRPLLARVPVWCITDTRAPLIGAARYAAVRARSS
ncbi:MAG: glucokinase [Thermodesulfobacteriota bacterium]